MIKRIKRYFTNRKRQRGEADYVSGYAYAAGKILKGMMTTTLIRQYESAKEMDEQQGITHPFDKGFSDALTDGVNKGLIPIRMLQEEGIISHLDSTHC